MVSRSYQINLKTFYYFELQTFFDLDDINIYKYLFPVRIATFINDFHFDVMPSLRKVPEVIISTVTFTPFVWILRFFADVFTINI